MMRDIATTAAGVAGGHLAANAIMGMVSGGKSEEPAPAPQAQGFTADSLFYAKFDWPPYPVDFWVDRSWTNQ